MILSNRDKTFIQDHLLNGEKLIKSNDIDLVLRKVSDVMLMEGFDANDEINDFGRMAERVYDNIFYNN